MDETKIHHGLITVAFGSTSREARERDLLPAIQKIRSGIRDVVHVDAIRSDKIRQKVETREGLHLRSLDEAFDCCAAIPCRDIYVQPLVLQPGREMERIRSLCLRQAHRFASIRIGLPLLSSEEGRMAAQHYIWKAERKEPDCRHLWMLHGWTSQNSCGEMRTIQQFLRSIQTQHTQAALMEGEPGLDSAIDAFKQQPIETGTALILHPFLLTLGHHAHLDLFGDHEQSWKSRLEKEGFKVCPSFQGLGSDPDIQRFFLEAAQEGIQQLGR